MTMVENVSQPSGVAHTTLPGSDTQGGKSKLCGPHNCRLDDAARTTPPGTEIGGGSGQGDLARITQPRSEIGCGSELIGAARTTPPETEIGGGSGLGDSARITQLRSQISGGSQPSSVAHTTWPRSKTGGGIQPRSDKDDVTQAVGPPRLSLYIDASTNPLPSDYGFIAASVAAQLQHDHVNPLSKE